MKFATVLICCVLCFIVYGLLTPPICDGYRYVSKAEAAAKALLHEDCPDDYCDTGEDGLIPFVSANMVAYRFKDILHFYGGRSFPTGGERLKLGKHYKVDGRHGVAIVVIHAESGNGIDYLMAKVKNIDLIDPKPAVVECFSATAAILYAGCDPELAKQWVSEHAGSNATTSIGGVKFSLASGSDTWTLVVTGPPKWAAPVTPSSL